MFSAPLHGQTKIKSPSKTFKEPSNLILPQIELEQPITKNAVTFRRAFAWISSVDIYTHGLERPDRCVCRLVALLFVLAVQLFFVKHCDNVRYCMHFNLAQTNQCQLGKQSLSYTIFICFFAFFLERFPCTPYANGLCYSFDYKPIVCFRDMNSVLSAHKTFKLLTYKKMNERVEERQKIPVEYDKLCLQTFANVREKQRSL